MNTTTRQKTISKCGYNRCMLPKNNKKYAVQLVYILISFFILVSNNNGLNFFTIFLFTFPIIVDLFTLDLSMFLLIPFKWGLLAYNLVILVFCICGFAGLISDNDRIFVVKQFVIFENTIEIKKSLVGKVLAFEVAVPVLMLIGSPTARKQRIINLLKEKEAE